MSGRVLFLTLAVLAATSAALSVGIQHAGFGQAPESVLSFVSCFTLGAGSCVAMHRWMASKEKAA